MVRFTLAGGTPTRRVYMLLQAAVIGSLRWQVVWAR